MVPRVPEEKRVAILAAVIAAVLLSTSAYATTVRALTFEQLIAGADAIVRGRVAALRTREDPASGAIWTQVIVEAERVLKGQPRVQLVFEQLGGRVGARELTLEGAPGFEVGDRAVWFVRESQRLTPILGLTQGRFPITTATGGDRVTLADGRAFNSVAEIGRPPRLVSPRPIPTLSLADFESAVIQAVAEGAAR